MFMKQNILNFLSTMFFLEIKKLPNILKTYNTCYKLFYKVRCFGSLLSYYIFILSVPLLSALLL